MKRIKNNCPCGRLNAYISCCGLIHQDIQLAKSAEDLMRSRYTAFTKGMGDYLMMSHHSTTRPISERQEIEKWANSVIWDRLEIISTSMGNEGDQTGTVEFKAFFYIKLFGQKKMDCIHENSKFVKENGHWMYISALDFN